MRKTPWQKRSQHKDLRQMGQLGLCAYHKQANRMPWKFLRYCTLLTSIANHSLSRLQGSLAKTEVIVAQISAEAKSSKKLSQSTSEKSREKPHHQDQSQPPQQSTPHESNSLPCQRPSQPATFIVPPIVVPTAPERPAFVPSPTPSPPVPAAATALSFDIPDEPGSPISIEPPQPEPKAALPSFCLPAAAAAASPHSIAFAHTFNPAMAITSRPVLFPPTYTASQPYSAAPVTASDWFQQHALPPMTRAAAPKIPVQQLMPAIPPSPSAIAATAAVPIQQKQQQHFNVFMDILVNNKDIKNGISQQLFEQLQDEWYRAHPHFPAPKPLSAMMQTPHPFPQFSLQQYPPVQPKKPRVKTQPLSQTPPPSFTFTPAAALTRTTTSTTKQKRKSNKRKNKQSADDDENDDDEEEDKTYTPPPASAASLRRSISESAPKRQRSEKARAAPNPVGFTSFDRIGDASKLAPIFPTCTCSKAECKWKICQFRNILFNKSDHRLIYNNLELSNRLLDTIGVPEFDLPDMPNIPTFEEITLDRKNILTCLQHLCYHADGAVPLDSDVLDSAFYVIAHRATPDVQRVLVANILCHVLDHAFVMETALSSRSVCAMMLHLLQEIKDVNMPLDANEDLCKRAAEFFRVVTHLPKAESALLLPEKKDAKSRKALPSVFTILLVDTTTRDRALEDIALAVQHTYKHPGLNKSLLHLRDLFDKFDDGRPPPAGQRTCKDKVMMCLFCCLFICCSLQDFVYFQQHIYQQWIEDAEEKKEGKYAYRCKHETQIRYVDEEQSGLPEFSEIHVILKKVIGVF